MQSGVASGENTTWLYHPEKKASPTGRLQLKSGEAQLEVDEAGSRWLLQEGKNPRPSAYGAPEPLVAVTQEAEGFSTVGKSGAVYFFEDPLGPFVSVRTAPQVFVQALQSGTSLIGLDRAGKIFRSEDRGRSWKAVEQQEFFGGISSTGANELIGYSIPERWFRSTDAGRTFEPLSLDSVAPLNVESRIDGSVIVDGLLETYLYQNGRFQSGAAPPLSTEGYTLPRYGGAEAIERRHAALRGERYVELRPSPNKGEWQVFRGSFSEPLTEFLTPGPAFCSQYQVVLRSSRHDEQPVLLCAVGKSAEVAPPFEVYRLASKSDGFIRVGGRFRGDLKNVHVAVSLAGRIALLGACPKELTEEGCSPEGVTLVEVDGATATISVPGLPQPSALAFDRDEKLWAVGHRQKDRHSLLVGPWQKVGDVPQIFNLTQLAGFPAANPSPFGIFPGESELLTVASKINGTHYLATVSLDGVLLGRGSGPPGVSKLDGAGKHIAALHVSDSVFWESTSGGISWTKRELPRALCRGGASCDPALACSESGCLVGDELTRIGWGQGRRASPSGLPESGEESAQPSRASGMVCRPAEHGWQPLPGLKRIPDISGVAQQDTLWSEIESFPDKAAANVLRVDFGEQALHRELLLAPVADAEAYAFSTFPQVEGSAAVRFKKPPSHLSTYQTTIEVAWDNRFENVTGRGSVSGDWGRRPMQYESGRQRSDLARPDYVGVAGQGLYLKFEDESSGSDSSYFFQGDSKSARVTQVFDKKWPHETAPLSGWFSRSRALSTARVERIHAFGHAGALLLIAGSRVVVRAWENPGHAGATEFSPYLMSSLGEETGAFAEGVQVAYRGTQIGFVTIQVDTLRGDHRAHFVGLGEDRAFDVPVEVPLLPDLPNVPRSCAEKDRHSTPRVIAPPFPGPSRNVRLLGVVGDVLELDTRQAVLFGSKQAPCLAAFEATRQRGVEETAQYRAFVAPDSGGISWLFRSETQLGDEQIHARPMRCEFQVDVPHVVP